MQDIEFKLKPKFDRKQYMKDYMKKHNDKPYITCNICKKTFKPCSEQAHIKTKFHQTIL